MTSPLSRLLGSAAAMVLIGLTGPALGQSSFTLEGTVGGLNASQACTQGGIVASLCGFDTADVLANLSGSPPSNNSFNTYPLTVGDCDFLVELFNNNKQSVDYEDMSPASQICGTLGAEAALIRNKNTWNVYCGSDVVQQMNLLPPPGPGNNSAEQFAICFLQGSCKAESEQDVEDACALLGNPDVIITEDIDGDGSLNLCACPGTNLAACSGQECFDDPSTEEADPTKLLETTTAVEVGPNSCKTFCKAATGGTGSAFNSCVQACQAAGGS